MTASTRTLENIRDIFSILHDGTISMWTGDKSLLTLKVDCQYLGERIDPSYDSFYIECRKIEKIELHPWMNPIELPQTLLADIGEIFKPELEILSAEIDNDFVRVSCSQHNPDFDYCGGNLLLSCEAIKVFDQTKRQLSIDEFGLLCKGYWDDFSKKVKQSLNDKKQP